LGFAALDTGDERSAVRFFSRCAELAGALAYDSLLARRSLLGLALLFARRGRHLESGRLLGCAERVLAERDEGFGALGERVREQVLANVHADLDAAREEGRRLRDSDLRHVVRDFVESLD
jgi:hypothetical protein